MQILLHQTIIMPSLSIRRTKLQLHSVGQTSKALVVPWQSSLRLQTLIAAWSLPAQASFLSKCKKLGHKAVKWADNPQILVQNHVVVIKEVNPTWVRWDTPHLSVVNQSNPLERAQGQMAMPKKWPVLHSMCRTSSTMSLGVAEVVAPSIKTQMENWRNLCAWVWILPCSQTTCSSIVSWQMERMPKRHLMDNSWDAHS